MKLHRLGRRWRYKCSNIISTQYFGNGYISAYVMFCVQCGQNMILGNLLCFTGVLWILPCWLTGIDQRFTGWCSTRPALAIDECVQGLNGGGKTGYTGPCPPSGTHYYHFMVYALDTRLQLTGHTGKAELEKAMQGHILAQGDLVGLYKKMK